MQAECSPVCLQGREALYLLFTFFLLFFFFVVVEIDHLQFLMIPVFSSLSLTKRAGREAKTQFSHCLVMLGVVYPSTVNCSSVDERTG